MADHAWILVADDDKAFRVATKTVLEDEGFTVALAVNGEEAEEKVRRGAYDLLLSDMVMGKMSGIELLKRVKVSKPDLPVIMVTGFGSIQTAVQAMRLGAADYLTKPSNNDELLIKVRRALEMQKKNRELRALKEELQGTFSFGNMVSRSPAMKDVIRHVQQVADTDVTVLIQGESGTGKELIARGLHFNSKRATEPFVVVNCSAIPENLLESELFGHERGAFTGATKQRVGKFEEANNGTLFLDEIGDTSLAIQTKLLRALQEKTFERVGGIGSISVNTRVVAATNRNLDLMMQQGDFREDLYYRLNVFPITLPPLRERPEDIPLLVDHFLSHHADLAGGKVKAVTTSVLTDLMNYTWRGNIRELENLVKRAIIKSTGDTITSIELPNAEPVALPDDEEAGVSVSLNTPYRDYIGSIMRHAEERYLTRMLRVCKGNINQVAKLMNVDRKTIYRKMSEYSIDPALFRPYPNPR